MTQDNQAVDVAPTDEVRPIPADIGKTVVTAQEVPVGTVIGTREDAYLVEPEPTLLEGYSSWLCCPFDNCEMFEIQPGKIDRVEPARVVLKPR